MRKEYDRITIHENLFNRQPEQIIDYKKLKNKINKIVENNFQAVFPGAKERAIAGKKLRAKNKSNVRNRNHKQK